MVKLAGSIAPSPNAILHNIELPANARSAKTVHAIILAEYIFIEDIQIFYKQLE